MKQPRITPKVTVLLPVYNGGDYLKRAIASILGQSYKDFELLIINDASADLSEEAILSFVDPRLRYVKNESNLNLLASLNKGLGLARGEFVARMDQDDISLPLRLEKQVAFLDNNPSVGVVGTAFQLIGQNGEKGQTVFPPTDHFALRWILCFANPLAHPSVMFRKDIITKVGGYTSSDLVSRGTYPSEDYDLWRRTAKATRLANLPAMLVYLRKHQTNYTSLHFRQHLEDACNISRIAIVDILREEVPISTVEAMWYKNYRQVDEVLGVFELIKKLCISYCKDSSLTLEQKLWLQSDAARRIIDLLQFSAAKKARQFIFKEAFSLAPLVAISRLPVTGAEVLASNLRKKE